MRIKEILRNINYTSWNIPRDMRGREIVSLCQNSKNADPTCLFFCKRGALTDGHRFARNAYENGARFFVVEREVDLPADAAVITVKDCAEEMKRLAVIFYGYPGKEMRLIGITGTKGKTTVALSVYYIGLSSGRKMGYIGTNGVYYCGQEFETANTTPDCIELQKALREMSYFGVTDVVIEVSSQALWQERTYGLDFEICAFTNLFEDHIGGVEHPSMLHYKKSKKKLFKDYNAKNIVINSDSPAAKYMLDGITCNNIVRTSAKGNSRCDLFAKKAEISRKCGRLGVQFELFSKDETKYCGTEIFVPTPGLYSVENALLTISICSLMGIEEQTVIDELSKLSIPGRFETVELENRAGTLFVIDYAHNGASLTAVLNSLREYEPRRIIVLFGSVGGRTFGRRAELAKAAENGADILIITSDNPNNEDPMDVIRDINKAIEDKTKPVYLIPDRYKAIEKAYEIAKDGDFVLLAGKGHETYQLICGKREPFSEKAILKKIDAFSLSYT